MVEWRPVLGWNGVYEVSDHGEVRSLARQVTVPSTGRTWWQAERLLRPYRTPPVGYLTLRLTANGRAETKRIHTMVLEAFVGPRPPRMVACHIDGNHDNNTVSNLRWDTQRSNMRDVVMHGKHHNVNKTHCKRGHLFDGANTYINPTSRGRQCRACMRETRARYARNR